MTARAVASIVADLVALGVRPGDTLMVHASMRALGPIDGGASGLIDALDLAVTDDGTLLMNLGADDPWSWVNDRPEREREAALADAPPFDSATAPAEPDIGVLAEVFRTAAGTVVNGHPEGRFGARGARAHALVADPPWDDYYGPGSPLERLSRAGGKVLRLGADLDTITLLHYAEYVTAVPDKRRITRHRRIATPNGPVIRTISCLDDSNGIVDRRNVDSNGTVDRRNVDSNVDSNGNVDRGNVDRNGNVDRGNDAEDYFISITRDALAADLATVGSVGDATAELFDATELVAFASDWMHRHLA